MPAFKLGQIECFSKKSWPVLDSKILIFTSTKSKNDRLHMIKTTIRWKYYFGLYFWSCAGLWHYWYCSFILWFGWFCFHSESLDLPWRASCHLLEHFFFYRLKYFLNFFVRLPCIKRNWLIQYIIEGIVQEVQVKTYENINYLFLAMCRSKYSYDQKVSDWCFEVCWAGCNNLFYWFIGSDFFRLCL